MFVRSVLSFFSVLAFGVMASAAVFAVMPWVSGHVPESARSITDKVQFESLALGIVMGVMLSAVARCNWADVPRQMITWFLVREQKFFYYVLIAICGAVIILY
jgi:uncharacterized membrane protein YidH (DUF202 family)